MNIKKACYKKDLVNGISVQLGLGKTVTNDVVTMLFDMITEKLDEGTKVQIYHFGVFKNVQRKARMGRNPSTSQPMKIEAKQVATFKSSSVLKANINKLSKK